MDTDARLYDAACELLAAAQALRATAAGADGRTAIAPTLGCLDAALQEVGQAVGTLRGGVAGEPDALHCALDDLAALLRLAARTADAARAASVERADSRFGRAELAAPPGRLRAWRGDLKGAAGR